ncbi:MAG: hypothetical protein LBS05_08310 [Tannerellaceae bacterium]|nr:hypothetical protein [Tannerellaceae bacterium]
MDAKHSGTEITLNFPMQPRTVAVRPDYAWSNRGEGRMKVFFDDYEGKIDNNNNQLSYKQDE